jgi:hypothetical protein
VRQCLAVSSPEKGSTTMLVSSFSTVHGGEVRSKGEIGRRTRGGRAHCEATVAAMAARLAARSGRGVDVGADEWSTARGGTARGALRGKGGGGDETGTVASGGAPLVASGTRVRRGMGGGGVPVGARTREGGGGGLATARARAGGPEHEHVRSGGLLSGSRLSAKKRERGRE